MSTHRLSVAALVLVSCAFISPVARAWNATGHQAAARIAWNDLKPTVREKVLVMLRQHPHFASHLEPADLKPDDPEYAARVFMNAAIWPDLMRLARNKSEREFHHPEWHFINTPIVADGTDKTALELPPLGESLEPGKPPENILQALEWNRARLTSADAKDADKAVALAWVEHLVGDVHQPLHCCARFTTAYPKGDRGGNLFMVKYKGNVTNLHTFWDDQLGGYMSPVLVNRVAETAAEAHPRAALAKELGATKFTDWSAESFALARDVVYAKGELPGVTREASVADKGASTAELPEEYPDAARDVSRRRVALAGYRLADLLNRLFE